MRRLENEDYMVIGLLLATLFCSIPFTQTVEVTEVYEENPEDWHNIISAFGGPPITWVTVELNRTADIRFMYMDGVWRSTENVLLASTTADCASFNYNAEYKTAVIEIKTKGPIHLRILYKYEVERFISIFGRSLSGVPWGMSPYPKWSMNG
ncbi:MAG: hypothetical protein JSW05_11455 [Candidatus Thorarchaeota archaeon]|nr:MAG: hypothetical protein JSW05_11455 [Candidatus Thorarchaeota archaeon]